MSATAYMKEQCYGFHSKGNWYSCDKPENEAPCVPAV